MRRLALALAVTLPTVAAPAATQAATRANQPALPKAIVVSAHRGGSAYAPEDTMYAYRNAVRIGADQMETDSWLTKDGVLVLIHDQSLDRTTSCTGNVTDKTFAQVERCDAGWWWTPGQSTTTPDPKASHPLRGIGIKVPAARHLFDFISSLGPDDKHTINIEIKDP